MKATAALAILMLTLPEAGWSQLSSEGGRSLDRIQFLKMWRLVDQLEIDVDQAGVLFPLLSRHHRKMDELRVQRKQAARDLRHILGGESSKDSELLAATEKVVDLDRRLRVTDDEFKKSLESHLTVRQRAKFVLFSDHFRRDLREMVEGIRASEDRGSRRREAPGIREKRDRD